MTDAERREAARQFIQKWNGKGKEDEDDRSYWIDLLSRVMGLENVTDHIEFQKKVIVDGNTKRIDAYIPETRVLIEQKTLGIALDKPIHQSGDIDLTPYEQAKRYNDNLTFDEKARWIVTSNFAEIWVYDMNMKVPAPEKISLTDLREQYSRLDFLISKETTKISQEMKVSLQAGELVGAIYDAFLKQYKDPGNPESLKSLNKLCVRIVFCLYAEDAGIFGVKNLFHDYLSQYDAKSARKALVNLFKVLDQKPEDRDAYLADDEPVLAEFPYVNGGLFADEEIEIPPLTDEIFNLILNNASGDFNWSQISPTIFGAVFESTLNPETRRSGGMHYTSIENIHKVIDPLFLNDLKAELNEIKAIDVLKTKDKRLAEYQKKLAGLKFLDPACGSGNFLTETYISIRRLENEVIAELNRGQVMLGTKDLNPIQVDIGQFYGIEINDFAVTVAKTALWIAESQMMKETEDVVKMSIDFLPLKTNAYIVEGNALTMDWGNVVQKNQLKYIMGNPPFVGMKEQSEEQKTELLQVTHLKKLKQMDYVAGWYFKASEFTEDTNIRSAFVSSNSITQGEQALTIWQPLFDKGININFAYTTFVWDSEANIKAHVHCVIIGFSYCNDDIRKIYENGTFQECNYINQYLKNEDVVFVEKTGKPISGTLEMTKGAQLIDDGHFVISGEQEYQDIIKREPQIKQYIRQYWNARDLLNNGEVKYAFYLENCPPDVIRSSSEIQKRVKAVYEFRINNDKPSTKALADRPSHYFQSQAPEGRSLVIPVVSSQRRRYIPVCFMNEGMVYTNAVFYIDKATEYEFGVLISNVHMSWARRLCGRMKSDYRYSNTIVYNTFPWPNVNDEQRQKIERTAQGILDARALYPECSLADLYDPLTMPVELKKAHIANDRAVMEAYGLNVKTTSEADCVAHLMKMYQELTK